MTSRTPDILNDLLAAETESYTERLLESGNYVSWSIAGRFAALRRIVEEEHDHERWLTEEILRLDAAPRPASHGIDTASAHYLDYESLLPRIIQDKRNLASAYKAALARVPPGSLTAGLLSRILARHEAHLATLQSHAPANAPFAASTTPATAPK